MKRSTDTRWSPAEIQQNQKEHYAAMAGRASTGSEGKREVSSTSIPGRKAD